MLYEHLVSMPSIWWKSSCLTCIVELQGLSFTEWHFPLWVFRDGISKDEDWLLESLFLPASKMAWLNRCDSWTTSICKNLRPKFYHVYVCRNCFYRKCSTESKIIGSSVLWLSKPYWALPAVVSESINIHTATPETMSFGSGPARCKIV